MGINMVVVSLSNLLPIHLVNAYGSEASAAFGVANQISAYVQMPAMAVGGAATSMAAQNIGAGKWGRVHRITRIGVAFNIGLTRLLVLVIHLYNREAVGLFLPVGGRAIDIGVHINNVTLWSFILFGIFNVVAGIVRSSVRIPLSYWLGGKYGLDDIWWSFPISFVIAVVLNAWYYRFGKWKEAGLLKSAGKIAPGGARS